MWSFDLAATLWPLSRVSWQWPFDSFAVARVTLSVIVEFMTGVLSAPLCTDKVRACVFGGLWVEVADYVLPFQLKRRNSRFSTRLCSNVCNIMLHLGGLQESAASSRPCSNVCNIMPHLGGLQASAASSWNHTPPRFKVEVLPAGSARGSLESKRPRTHRPPTVSTCGWGCKGRLGVRAVPVQRWVQGR